MRMRHWLLRSAGEAARFVVGGGVVAVVSVAVYWVLATPLGIAPLLANVVSSLTHLALGYNVHRVFSFKAGPAAGRPGDRPLRYLLAWLGAFALNSLWVWLLTGPARLPAWTPIIPMVIATPVATFWVNRRWVFASGPARTV